MVSSIISFQGTNKEAQSFVAHAIQHPQQGVPDPDPPHRNPALVLLLGK
jgi:hypothetical protein